MLKGKRLFPKKESALIYKFMEKFHELEPTAFSWKTHGQPMQTRGIPDVIFCFEGLFYGIEFKIMRSGKLNITPYQESTIQRIVGADGYVFVVWWDEKTSDVGVQMKKFKGKNAIEQAVVHVIQEMKYIQTMNLRKKIYAGD